jgi:hypothetical protein
MPRIIRNHPVYCCSKDLIGEARGWNPRLEPFEQLKRFKQFEQARTSERGD